MYVGTKWHDGLRVAQANANMSGEAWVVWANGPDVHCAPAVAYPLTSTEGPVYGSATIVKPVTGESSGERSTPTTSSQ